MYTLENVTLKLSNRGEVSVIGDDRLSTERLPIRMFNFAEDGFIFNVQNGFRQYHIPFKNIDTTKIIVPVDMIFKSVPEEVECPALFLYDLLADYTSSKKGIKDFDLSSIKERHRACSGIYEGIDLEELLSKFCG